MVYQGWSYNFIESNNLVERITTRLDNRYLRATELLSLRITFWETYGNNRQTDGHGDLKTDVYRRR